MKIKVFQLEKNYLTLTSALHPKGITVINRVMSLFVDKGYSNKNPISDILDACRTMSIDCDTTVGFITAAKNYSFFKEDYGKVFISAGIDESGENAGSIGTINIAVFLDVNVSLNGLIDLIRTVTEAKSGALMDLKLNMTGTVSDALAVGTIIHSNDEIDFLGPATELGKRIAKDIRNTIKMLLSI